MTLRDREDDIVWHSGGVSGFRAFIGYRPNSQTGVVVLSNTFAGPIGNDDIGFHLLDSDRALAPFRTEVSVEGSGLDSLTGEYVCDGGRALKIVRDGDFLFILSQDGNRARIFAEEPYKWFLKIVDAQVAFTQDSCGRTTGLTWHQDGAEVAGRRADSELPTPCDSGVFWILPK